MVSQIGGMRQYFDHLLDAGKTYRIMLLSDQNGAFDFNSRAFTNIASIEPWEVVDVAAGYTSGVGGTVNAGARDIRGGTTYWSFDIANITFTNVILSAGSCRLVGFAIINETDNVVKETVPFSQQVDLDAVQQRTITVPINDISGLFGIIWP